MVSGSLPALSFGFIHGTVGELQQDFCRPPLFGVEGAADAHPYLQMVAIACWIRIITSRTSLS